MKRANVYNAVIKALIANITYPLQAKWLVTLLAHTVRHLHNRTHLHTYIVHFTPTPHPHCPPTYVYTHSSLIMQHYWSHTVRGCNTIYIFHSHSSTSVCSQRRPIWQKCPAYLTLWTAHPTPTPQSFSPLAILSRLVILDHAPHPPHPTVLQSTCQPYCLDLHEIMCWPAQHVVIHK